MKHLVIFYTENGIYSAVYNFKNIKSENSRFERHKRNAKRYTENRKLNSNASGCKLATD